MEGGAPSFGCELFHVIDVLALAMRSCERGAATPSSLNTIKQKENEELVPPTFPPMKIDTFTFQWETWRREADRQLGVSVDFDKKNNLVQVIDVSEIGLAEEKN